ncbi:hypothetical protein P9202_1292 [Prochlorococcus marinus str. MIT 9202]|nr:hypothetical protein P9202_1292 [Prochlorococcus marinus str. MIT 9202]
MIFKGLKILRKFVIRERKVFFLKKILLGFLQEIFQLFKERFVDKSNLNANNL